MENDTNEDGFEPGQWWQVRDLSGKLWCETSSESEARRKKAEGFTLHRLYKKVEQEWREVD